MFLQQQQLWLLPTSTTTTISDTYATKTSIYDNDYKCNNDYNEYNCDNDSNGYNDSNYYNLATSTTIKTAPMSTANDQQ